MKKKPTRGSDVVVWFCKENFTAPNLGFMHDHKIDRVGSCLIDDMHMNLLNVSREQWHFV